MEVLLGFLCILHFVFYFSGFWNCHSVVIYWIGIFVSDEVRLITYACLCMLSVEIEIPIEKMKHLQGKGTYTLNRIFSLICNNILHIFIFGFPERILLLASL
jgi:hypothetical protein